MKQSRRSFLKTATLAAPAAAVAAALPASAATVETVVAASPAAAYPYVWWLSTNGGEIFHEQFDTKEQALAALKQYGHGMIAECQQQDFDLSMEGDDVLEFLYGRNEEVMGEDGEFLSYTPEQERELGAMVTAAIAAWADKHKIKKTAWVFGDVRNQIDAEPVEAKV